MNPYQLAPSVYPADQHLIQGILRSLSLDSTETSKLTRCRTKSRCHSSYCPACLRLAGYQRRDQLTAAAAPIPGPRLKFGTFVAKDVTIDSLKDASQAVMRATRAAFAKLGIDTFALRLEASNNETTDSYHPHTHFICETATGGRKFVAAESWRDEYLDALPSWLHPAQGGSLVEPVRDLDAASSYLAKSSYAKCAEASDSMLRRIVNGITATLGVQKFNVRGSLAA